MSAPVRTRRPASRRRSSASAVGGFTIGLLAVTTSLLFSGGSGAPTSEAAEAAARAAGGKPVVTGARPASPSSTLASQVSSAPVPPSTPQTFTDGALFSPQGATRVVIKSVGIDATVRPVGYVFQHGKLEYDVPRIDAGEYVTGAQVGKRGNAVIGGHVSRRGVTGVFANLPQVVAGDVVEVYRGDRLFRYSVVEIRIVAPDATSVMSQTQDATLTLITCFPDEQYQDRLVVVGRLL